MRSKIASSSECLYIYVYITFGLASELRISKRAQYLKITIFQGTQCFLFGRAVVRLMTFRNLIQGTGCFSSAIRNQTQSLLARKISVYISRHVNTAKKRKSRFKKKKKIEIVPLRNLQFKCFFEMSSVAKVVHCTCIRGATIK